MALTFRSTTHRLKLQSRRGLKSGLQENVLTDSHTLCNQLLNFKQNLSMDVCVCGDTHFRLLLITSRLFPDQTKHLFTIYRLVIGCCIRRQTGCALVKNVKGYFIFMLLMK